MLRNKTLVYQEENSRWRSLGFSDFVSFVILLKQMNDTFCFPQELLRIFKKANMVTVTLGSTFHLSVWFADSQCATLL